MIPVTKPFLPPRTDYEQYLTGIWERNWLTNNGPLVRELEEKLNDFLEIKNLQFVSNGTIAIQIAIKALELKGEIITTPFSYVATTSSIVWESCEPVFADIDPETLNIDPSSVEKVITPRTSAILATHVYGNPCDVQALETIARKHNLKIIYDAAHAFNVKINGKSIFEYGDISTTSFHSTKLFHTIEGGAMVAADEELVMKIGFLRNFGHDGHERFSMLGVNGKNSEFHAAMGLANLKYIDSIIATRKKISQHYDKRLAGFSARKQTLLPGTAYNYAYYPLQLESEESLHTIINRLNAHEIFPRRYFYPTLDKMPYIRKKSELKNAWSAAERALCLPLYHTLTTEEVDSVCDLIIQS